MPRGGKRSGAGRRATKLSRTIAPLKRTTAEEVLAEIDEKQAWHELLNAEITIPNGKNEPITVADNRLRADVLKYLTNRRDGMPAQSLKHSGDADSDPIKVLLIGSNGNGAHA